MTKATYLLGAGASYHALPIVGEMSELANIFAKVFYSSYRQNGKQLMQSNGIAEERWNESRTF